MEGEAGLKANAKIRFALVAILAVGLAGCETTGTRSGPAVSALSAGVLASDFGSGLDPRARKMAANAEFVALETGRAGAEIPWKASETVYGSVIPQQPYQVGSSNCRRYVHTITQNGQSRSTAATACRNADGIWVPLS
ncbi:MAG: hypothetical protein R3D34_06745 [Nitratireductor sp.]